MNEPIEEGQIPSTAPAAVTAGGLLRAAREAQGLDLAVLAAQLKVAPRKLEALEADRHDELQGATFVRALAQAACRALKQDPAPVLIRLPQAGKPALTEVSGGLNAPFRERSGLREAGESWLARRGFAGLIAVLVLAAGGLLWLPGGWQDWRPWPSTPAAPHDEALVNAANNAATVGVPLGATQMMGAAASEPEAQLPVLPRAVDGQAPPMVQPVEAPSLAPSAMASAASAPRPASTVPVAAVPVAASAPRWPVAVASSPVSASAPAVALAASRHVDLLEVRTQAQSWIEVVDGSGKQLLGRVVQPGESLSLDGAMPMKIKVGNVKGTELKLRGQVVDMASAARDNIARLELK